MSETRLKPPVATETGVKAPVAWTKVARRVVLYVVLTIVGLSMILPFLWMLSTSLKTKQGAVEYPPQWIPKVKVTQALVDGKSVLVRVLMRTAEVKRLDDGEAVTVYEEALRTRKPWWNPWAKPTVSVRFPVEGHPEQAAVDVPVEVLSTTTRVRVLEKGLSYEKVLDLPGRDVTTYSKVNLNWSNYPETWSKLPFGRSYLNTLFIAVTVTVGQVLTSSLAAFAFARLRFPGRDKLFLSYLATMMVPGTVTLIPVYLLFVKFPELLNWLFHTVWFKQDLYFLGQFYVGRLIGGNSYFALIAPGLFSAYGTFMLRQFFMGLSRDLEDAARIDGCGNLRIYWHVTLPLSRVALATLGTFTFMGIWHEFMWPLLILSREELVPLQVLLSRFQGQYGAEYTLLMAGSLIVMLPLLVVFLLGQRYFVKGIQLGAVKG